MPFKFQFFFVSIFFCFRFFMIFTRVYGYFTSKLFFFSLFVDFLSEESISQSDCQGKKNGIIYSNNTISNSNEQREYGEMAHQE